MAISPLSNSDSLHAHTPLVQSTVDFAVDYHGNPALKACSGGWRSAYFLIGVEVAERFAYFGISCNLITYLTGPLGQSTATAAENVNAWSGTAQLLPLLGAFLADSILGRYRTIIIASVIYILGLGLLTLSAGLVSTESHGRGRPMLPSLSNSDYTDPTKRMSSSPQLLEILFLFSLYLVAVGQGGQKPCVQAFGADQFDGADPKESKAKSSFFNWWFFAVCSGAVLTVLVSSYIQDNLSWSLGFGALCIIMIAGLCLFLFGTRTYRYSVRREEKSPFLRIGGVFVTALINWRKTSLPIAIDQEEAHGTLQHHSSQKFRFLNKALLFRAGLEGGGGKVYTVHDVEEAKAALSLIPIWGTSLVYAIVYAQCSTFFTKQGATMDRTIFPGFEMPAASLQSLIGLAIVLIIPIYDRIFVPVARNFTRKPSGITMLQRIGTGMLLSVICMVVAALVEKKRLETAREYGLVDMPNVTIPMGILWLVPQYVLSGIADVFALVGLQEFFYDQVPIELRSVGVALYLSILGVGSFLSSFLVSVIEAATGGIDGQASWFADNLNKAHLDYFYWLLAGLSAAAFTAFLFFSKSYIYVGSSSRM
ncbi:hypothetical protein I3843_07G230900 [Carya illinoinensis]|uniref:Protein NRT1/ PTR FAMILY 5.10-like n=1 Tax=Carya illinoinensis TaxID=32201 RepID=A0A922EPY7_CARIL|nr:protein NRT1/ PTR FAMILY 5.10-like isoform X1 [Carya illinoinensis]KAG2700453.1 hypothetical protein I3760_07G231400 [Carya illinoinensis]KAG6706765.1 hypothetical protein I3842_07G237800 [Carya illinoinensis]KAG7973488.1 hypothetical protein I3843_07G230900 [Carya illinoinensis]